MKRIFRRFAAVLLCALPLFLCSCSSFSGKIYGKPLEELSSAEQSHGMTLLTYTMEYLRDGDLESLNAMGYHAGLPEAETFEELMDDYQALSKAYGDAESVSLKEAYRYGEEKAFVGRVSMSGGGELMLSLLFTDAFELALGCIYETEEAFFASRRVPEGVAEEEIVLGEGTEHPLPGKLTFPLRTDETVKMPAVVLVTGDGGNTMDLKAGATKAYEDIAWALARKGIASLRYDKRIYTYREEVVDENAPASVFTVGYEYTEDAVLAAEVLRSVSFVDPERIFYVGHSQGAVVGGRAQEEGGDFAGFLLIGSSARPWYDVIYDQYIHYGLIDQSTEAIYYLVKKMDTERDFIMSGDYEKLSEDQLAETFLLSRPAAFWKDYLSFDYIGSYAAGTEPILILQGETDYQTTKEVDFSSWEEALAGRADTEFVCFPGLNHLLTPSQGIFAGHYKEYDMPGAVPEEVTDLMAEFIWKHSNP